MTLVSALLATKLTSNSTIENFKDSMILPSKPYIEELKADPIPQLQRYQDMPVIEGITRDMGDEALNLTKNLDLIYQSALGTTLHHFLEHEIFEPDEKSVDTRLFELGVPSQLRDCYCKKILQLLENSRNDSKFDIQKGCMNVP